MPAAVYNDLISFTFLTQLHYIFIKKIYIKNLSEVHPIILWAQNNIKIEMKESGITVNLGTGCFQQLTRRQVWMHLINLTQPQLN